MPAVCRFLKDFTSASLISDEAGLFQEGSEQGWSWLILTSQGNSGPGAEEVETGEEGGLEGPCISRI